MGHRQASVGDSLIQIKPCPPLTRQYFERESRWRDFLDRHVSDWVLLRWGAEHRVFRCGNRVLKIEWANAANQDPRLRLNYEFSLLETLEGGALHLAPSFRVIDDEWHVLEMDWVEGEYLEELIRGKRARQVSIFQLAVKLLQISLAGIVYKQLRARHIIRRANGELVFLDFGSSIRANPLIAFWRNFSPISFTNGSWQTGRLAGIFHSMLFADRAAANQALTTGQNDRTSLHRALLHWRANDRRSKKARPEYLAHDPGDASAAAHFVAMEKYLSNALEAEPAICNDFFNFQLTEYRIHGIRDWGFMWDHIVQHVDFTGKTIVDLASGMGGVGAFARLEGAARVNSYDYVSDALDATQQFAEAFGFADNTYSVVESAKFESGKFDISDANIITALSTRLDKLSRTKLLDILSRFPEILWQTIDPQVAHQDLINLGYRTVETVVHSGHGQYILYATDRKQDEN